MKNENLSAWLFKAKEFGIDLESFNIYEDKLTEIADLIRSGLPTYAYHIYPLLDFFLHTDRIMPIFEKYNNLVVVRAVPISRKYQRYTAIGKTYEQSKIFLLENISKETIEQYKVIINEYDSAACCGVVISAPSRLIIEIVEEKNLEKLCHGHITPWHGEFLKKFYRFRKMHYIGNIPQQIKEKMWIVVKQLSAVSYNDGCIPSFTPKLGDFEFVFSQRDNSLKFIEYKNVLWKFLK